MEANLDLQSLKVKLKNIEREFLEVHSRKPNKEDVINFSPEIQDLYKHYHRLKNANSISSQSSSFLNKIAQPNVAKDTVWGSHLNKSNAVEKEPKQRQMKKPCSTNSQYAKKLRENMLNWQQKEKLELKKRKEEETNNTLEKGEEKIKDDAAIQIKFKISSSCDKSAKSTPVNIFGMQELSFPSSNCVDSSFDTSQNKDVDELVETSMVEQSNSFIAKQLLSEESPVKDIKESEIKIDDSNGNIKSTVTKQKRASDTSDFSKKVASKRIKLDLRDLEEKNERTFETKNTKNAQSENYVRINLKKRVYSRRKKGLNYKKYKLNKWKELQRTNKPFKKVSIAKKLNSDSEESEFDTCLEKAEFRHEMKSSSNQNAVLIETKVSANVEQGSYALAKSYFKSQKLPADEMEAEVKDYLKVFGYDSFRPGQLEAVISVLSGLPALVVQPTGSGKSLCYQLPALLYAEKYSCISIVISPLVSLMEDQLDNMPKILHAACLHTNMTDRQREKTRAEIADGSVKLLFISPESLVGGAGYTFGCLPPNMPPIAFVCIDEVHCVSTWSHNFRPCYLRLCQVVREVLGVKCILGLTATATALTMHDISFYIGMESNTQDLTKMIKLPSNLRLTVSRDHGDKALIELLESEPFSSCKSIIIYCIRRQTTERLATLIRTYFQSKGVKDEDEWSAESYHAGLTPARRRNVQKRFMQSKLRILVATVAFGMGLNKSDVRAVIHYDLPKSMESYVQEIGRAGRDGVQAFCHVFLDMKGEDRQELKRHIYSDTVDRSTVRKLLELVFASSISADEKLQGSEEAFSVEETVTQLDLKQEAIETLLIYLELHPDRPIKLLNCTYGTCKVYCYSDTSNWSELATKCPAIALALRMKSSKEMNKDKRMHSANMLQFPLVKFANFLGCGVVDLRRQLKKLQWEEIPLSQGGVKYQKTGVVVQFIDLCFHLKTSRTFTNEQIDNYIEYLHQKIVFKENSQLEQLQHLYDTMRRFSISKFRLREGQELEEKSEELKAVINCYFNKQPGERPSLEVECEKPILNEEEVRCNIRQLLSVHHQQRFTGRAVARIFHGIGSPNFPAKTWSSVRQFWRRHLNVDFNILCHLATKEILNR